MSLGVLIMTMVGLCSELPMRLLSMCELEKLAKQIKQIKAHRVNQIERIERIKSACTVNHANQANRANQSSICWANRTKLRFNIRPIQVNRANICLYIHSICPIRWANHKLAEWIANWANYKLNWINPLICPICTCKAARSRGLMLCHD